MGHAEREVQADSRRPGNRQGETQQAMAASVSPTARQIVRGFAAPTGLQPKKATI